MAGEPISRGQDGKRARRVRFSGTFFAFDFAPLRPNRKCFLGTYDTLRIWCVLIEAPIMGLSVVP